MTTVRVAIAQAEVAPNLEAERRVKEESMTLDVSGHYARPDSFEFRPIRHHRSAV